MENEPHAPYNITIAYYETHNTQLTHYYDKRNQVLYLRKDLSEEECCYITSLVKSKGE